MTIQKLKGMSFRFNIEISHKATGKLISSDYRLGLKEKYNTIRLILK